MRLLFLKYCREQLEEERLAIERHYEEKLELMRNEMESRNEREKDRLMQELEKLRLSSPVEIPTVSGRDEGTPLGSPGAEDDPYQVMKSIAFQPLDTGRPRGTSIRIRDITGGGEDTSSHSDTSSRSPTATLEYSSSPSPQVPVEIPLLSPATGQHNTVSLPISESPLDPEMKQLLETYEVIDSSRAIPSMKPAAPMDMPDGAPEHNSYVFSLGYEKGQSRYQHQADNVLSASCPPVANLPQHQAATASSELE